MLTDFEEYLITVFKARPHKYITVVVIANAPNHLKPQEPLTLKGYVKRIRKATGLTIISHTQGRYSYIPNEGKPASQFKTPAKPVESPPAAPKPQPASRVANKKQVPRKRLKWKSEPVAQKPDRKVIEAEAISKFLETKQITICPSTGSKEIQKLAPLTFDPVKRVYRRIKSNEQEIKGRWGKTKIVKDVAE